MMQLRLRSVQNDAAPATIGSKRCGSDSDWVKIMRLRLRLGQNDEVQAPATLLKITVS